MLIFFAIELVESLIVFKLGILRLVLILTIMFAMFNGYCKRSRELSTFKTDFLCLGTPFRTKIRPKKKELNTKVL